MWFSRKPFSHLVVFPGRILISMHLVPCNVEETSLRDRGPPPVLDSIRYNVVYSSGNRTVEHMLQTTKNGPNVVSALHARSNFGKLLRRVSEERKSLVIEKRGTPQAVLLSIRDYVRLAAPEPEILRLIGEESVRKGTDKLTSRQIDREIAAARRARKR